MGVLAFRAIAIALSVWTTAAHAQTLPCVNANAASPFLSRTMTFKVDGRPDIAVEATIVSLDSASGELRVDVRGLADPQAIRPKVVKISPKAQSMMSQMPMPNRRSLGTMKGKFPLRDVRVEQGVIRYPNCTMGDPGHEIVFAGTLTFDANELGVEGEFFDYSFPPGAPELTGTNKTGA